MFFFSSLPASSARPPQVSGYTRQFLAQEVADEKMARSKLENKWFGPGQDDLDDSELMLSGKVAGAPAARGGTTHCTAHPLRCARFASSPGVGN